MKAIALLIAVFVFFCFLLGVTVMFNKVRQFLAGLQAQPDMANSPAVAFAVADDGLTTPCPQPYSPQQPPVAPPTASAQPAQTHADAPPAAEGESHAITQLLQAIAQYREGAISKEEFDTIRGKLPR